MKGGSKVYHHLGYVLTTGANWAKPIGKFTLTIDREPNTVLSLCWDKSLRKVGPNRFQAVKENFLPKKDWTLFSFMTNLIRYI